MVITTKKLYKDKSHGQRWDIGDQEWAATILDFIHH